MKKKLIYAIDDELSIRELYQCALENDFEIKTFSNAKDFFLALNKEICDLLLLDLMLPYENGFDVIKELKSNNNYRNIKVIMVSAKGSEIDKVRGLNCGADDYLSKPFGVLELVARINANLRKTTEIKKEITAYKDISIDFERHEILLNGICLALSLKEYEILLYFLENNNKVITKEDLFRNVWNEGVILETRTLDVHISSLRKKIIKSQTKIETVHGVGFILK